MKYVWASQNASFGSSVSTREWKVDTGRWGGRQGRTGPGEHLVAPKRGGVVQVLHERIMTPETHTVDHAPLDVFVVFIGRDLEHVRVVIGQGVSSQASFCSTMGTRR
jgi:hypothetical protein